MLRLENYQDFGNGSSHEGVSFGATFMADDGSSCGCNGPVRVGSLTNDQPWTVVSGDIVVPLLVPYSSHRFASFCIDLHSSRPPRGRGVVAKKRNKLRVCRSLLLMPQGVAAFSEEYQRRDLNPHVR